MPVGVGVKPGVRALSGTQPRGRRYPLAARYLRTQWESMWEYGNRPGFLRDLQESSETMRAKATLARGGAPRVAAGPLT